MNERIAGSHLDEFYSFSIATVDLHRKSLRHKNDNGSSSGQSLCPSSGHQHLSVSVCDLEASPPLPVSLRSQTGGATVDSDLDKALREEMLQINASNATELAFQALRAHSTVFTYKQKERERREEGLHGSKAGVKEVFQGITMFPATPKKCSR